jgi:hypothetical protein
MLAGAKNKRVRSISAALTFSVCFVSSGVGLLPSAVQADDTLSPRVWIAPIQSRKGVAGASMLATKFDDVARKQLQWSAKVQTSNQGVMGPVTAGEADPRIEQAERLRVAAKEAIQQDKNELAFKQLKAALELYEAGLASVGKLEAVLETLGYLGSVALTLGYDADAKDYFRRVVAMAPDAEPLDEYSDTAKAFFSKIKKRLLRKKRGEIRITSTPKGAEVMLDGVKQKRKTPLTIRRLVRGHHYVQLSHPEAGLAAQVIKVRSRRRTKVKLTLSTEVGPKAPGKASAEDIAVLTKAVEKNQLNRAFRKKAKEIAELTNCRYVVVGLVGAEGNGFVLNAFVYGLKERQVVALDRFKFRADIASTMIQSARFAKAIEQTVVQFPEDKVLSGGVFVIRAEPVAAPVPAARPAPPVVQRPAPTQRPKVVTKPRPAEPKPAARPAAQPAKADADLGRRLAQPAPAAVKGTGDATYVRRKEWYKTWWFWTATGVVATGAIGGYFLLQEDEQSGQFEVDVRW